MPGKFVLTYGMLEKGNRKAYQMISWNDVDSLIEDRSTSDTVFLTGLFFDYDAFHPDAISNNLISWDGTNLQDVPNRTQSPYLVHTVFQMTASKYQIYMMLMKQAT